MILLPWTSIDAHFHTRTLHGDAYGTYCAIIHFEVKYYYHAYDLNGNSIFKLIGSADSDYVDTLEEAKNIVDAALVKAGWILLNDDEKFSKLKVLL